MRKTFAPFDDALIERLFQPAADFIAHRVGCGRVAATCFCVDLASLAWIVSRASDLADAFANRDTSGALGNLSLLLLGLAALLSLRALFRRAACKPANPLRPAMQPHRAVVLLMLASQLVQARAPALTNAADVVMLLGAAAALYLGACGEPPRMRTVSPSALAAG
jgi:hypothetical protein